MTCQYAVVKSGKIPGELDLKYWKAFNAPD